MKAYKAFDKNLKCRDTQYEVGYIFTEDSDEIVPCKSGIHVCERMIDIYNYYPRNYSTRVCEIIINTDKEFANNGDKISCREIEIVRELSKDEIKQLTDDFKFNSGHRNSGGYNSGNRNSGDYNSGHYNSGHRNSGNNNSGDYNSGDYNSGHRNSGYRNSGDYNSGDYNSGRYNSGDYNSGHRNSGYMNSGGWNKSNRETGFFNDHINKVVNVFNKPCLLSEWDNASKPNFLYFDVVVNGETLDYKEAFKQSLERQSNIKEQLEMLKKIPNFDKEVFKNISGIDIGDYE